MTNFESVLKAMAEALNAEAPLGIAIITIVFFFSLVIRLYDFICHSALHEMRQIQKQLGECQETITELEKSIRLFPHVTFILPVKIVTFIILLFVGKLLLKRSEM